MVTLKTIAEEAGVSAVTVSNVIHHNYSRVSAETVDKINRIIEKHHYVPNSNARSLAMKKSHIIGIIIPYVGDGDNFLKSPYNAEIIGVLERVIRDSGYYLMVRSVGTTAEAIPLIRSWNVDAVIFLSAFGADVQEIRKRLDLPVVFIDTYAAEETFDNVGVEDRKGEYLATKYLLNMGHKRVWFVGPELKEDTREGVISERYAGYLEAMTEAGLESELRHLVAEITSYECGIEIGRKLAFEEEPPTAVVATADILAIGIMEGYRLSGRRIPEDLSVVGFDNLPEGRYTTPKLTTVSQDIAEKARLAAGLLLEQLGEGAGAEEEAEKPDTKEEGTGSRRITVDVALVERGSCLPLNR
jgi:LacI family transcriptional regulator